MMKFLAGLGRLGVTLLAVAIAAVVGTWLWNYYLRAPWTRDGRVQADVVQVTPDVSGLVAKIMVRDNQAVHVGDPLFQIDRARFELALQQEEAIVASRLSALQEATLEQNRYAALTSLSVSQEKQQQVASTFQQAAAAYQQAQVDRGVAKLNLDRALVTASVNGIVTNFDLRPGDYVTAGHAVNALVDTDSLRVDGYFEETKLSQIHPGDPARVRLLGVAPMLHGHVESIAGGITDRERSPSAVLLANINPTFNWVRLAQRIPVRVKLTDVPDDVRLLPGRTATVMIDPPPTPTTAPTAAPAAAPTATPAATPTATRAAIPTGTRTTTPP